MLIGILYMSMGKWEVSILNVQVGAQAVLPWWQKNTHATKRFLTKVKAFSYGSLSPQSLSGANDHLRQHWQAFKGKRQFGGFIS